ncbi:hypothetical protein [Roseovarius aestuariivivens]|uniref:hypothetical protein n=1 Tax=Roseovarius aestuariivivens TaxID=1888910 RepID=UPI00107FFD80|nr:hypothetical protein [Roseovarius aestuariivivens]
MDIFGPIMTRICVVVTALAFALGGVVMTFAQPSASPNASADLSGPSSVEDNAHASHEFAAHMDHGQTETLPSGHEDHADCAMMACCFMADGMQACSELVVGAGLLDFGTPAAHQLAEADRARADKPPKHA